LFCCAGGATKGLQRAGFHVVGVDIDPQPHYCGDAFIQVDALAMFSNPRKIARIYDFLWASPPCQKYTLAQRIRGNDHPDLIAPVRDFFEATGLPWCIENVPGAPLLNPIELCGAMFGLRVYRHRLFECSFPVTVPEHMAHLSPLRKMGRPPKEGDFMHVVGNFSGVEQARKAMGIDWMVRDELREAIPPAYAEFIGRQALVSMRRTA
jgi:DNA (cytosine-5)-methyltransferase 1